MDNINNKKINDFLERLNGMFPKNIKKLPLTLEDMTKILVSEAVEGGKHLFGDDVIKRIPSTQGKSILTDENIFALSKVTVPELTRLIQTELNGRRESIYTYSYFVSW